MFGSLYRMEWGKVKRFLGGNREAGSANFTCTQLGENVTPGEECFLAPDARTTRSRCLLRIASLVHQQRAPLGLCTSYRLVITRPHRQTSEGHKVDPSRLSPQTRAKAQQPWHVFPCAEFTQSQSRGLRSMP